MNWLLRATGRTGGSRWRGFYRPRRGRASTARSRAAPPLSIWARGLRRRRALRQRYPSPAPPQRTAPHPTLPCRRVHCRVRACSPTPPPGPLPTACTEATLPARPCARGREHRWGRVCRCSSPRQKVRTSPPPPAQSGVAGSPALPCLSSPLILGFWGAQFIQMGC